MRLIAIRYQYGVTAPAIFHGGRRGAALRTCVAPVAWAEPALSRQILDLENELGFKLFDRLSRGVKLSAAGKLFLEDTRRILQAVNEAAARATRVALGQSGTLRVGFPENASWHGVVPESFRRLREQQPEAELQLQPVASLEQLDYTIRPTGRRVSQFHAKG